jgi:D-alanyl-D-alanine carboxypeptidase
MNQRQLSLRAVLALLTLTILLAGGAFFYFSSPTLSYTINLMAEPGKKLAALTYGAEPALSNPDFFGQVKAQFLADQANFIEADLSNMTLRVYKAGAVTAELPIETKGKEGSWWETPAGLYQVLSKEKTHFSTMGHVYMPWSLQFQGNFFIHGRTYYPDGTPTATQFTGGCIRLATEDAKKVYDLVMVGTPVLVFQRDFSSDNFNYETLGQPTIGAESYLAADLRNNHVFWDKNTTTPLPIASITKLVTALIATEYINLDNLATVPTEALIYTSKPRLQAGQTYSVYQLLFPLLRESSNEAAETIARYYGRENFVGKMNAKAAAIGMKNTHFVDPSGAGAANVSTAEDLFMLAKYIYNNRSFIFKITSGQLESSIYGTHAFADLGNFNDFVDNPFFFGGKNGQTTAARETNLTVLELPLSGLLTEAGASRRPIVLVVLGAENARTEGQTLINYLTAQFLQNRGQNF